MIGLTAIISTIGGHIFGLLPDLTRALLAHFNHKRDLEHRKSEADARTQELNAARELAAAEAQGRAAVEYWRTMAAEVRANRQQFADALAMQSKPTGIWWIDLLNAVIRPGVSVATLVAFFALLAVATNRGLPPAFLEGLLATFSMMVEMVVGWFFGYRAATKPIGEPFSPAMSRIGGAVAGAIEGRLAISRPPRA